MPVNCKVLKVIQPKDETLHKQQLISIKASDDQPPLTTYEVFLTGIDKLKDFKVYSDDVFLCGFMRSGTTLMQEMIWLIANDFDFERARSVVRFERFPFFE
jgi:hypothetical protein